MPSPSVVRPGRPARMIEPPSIPDRSDRRALEEVAAHAERALFDVVRRLAPIRGSGQEMGSEANGPGVNLRRAALSVLMSRYSGRELEKRLPNRKGRVLKTIASDLSWLRAAERAPIRSRGGFDFSWSENPMSTPDVLSRLAKDRARAAERAAAAIEADPRRPHDASNDGVLTHLYLADPELRAQVLTDTLVQLRADRRSEVLMDAGLVDGEGGAYQERARGRIGSSGAIAAFEQRWVAKLVEAGDDPLARREYALTRWVLANQANGSINGIYAARNAVGALVDFIDVAEPIAPELGHSTNVFDAIHKNYSANTPSAIDHYLRERVFTDGPREARVEILAGLVKAAESADEGESRAILSELCRRFGYEVPALSEARTQAARTKAIVRHLKRNSDVPSLRRGLSDAGVLKACRLLLVVHRSVCAGRPSVEELERELFYAGRAWPEVAALIHALKEGGHIEQVDAVGRARSALKESFLSSSSGFERQMIWRLDKKVELLSAEILGRAVTRANRADEEGGRGEVLLAVRSALAGVVASGLDAVRARGRRSPKVEGLSDLLREVDALLEQGRPVSEERLRGVMTRVFRAATEAADSLRGFIRAREKAIHFSDIDVDLDPGLIDSLVKETPLHYLLSLSQAGMVSGLEAKISADEIRFVEGMRVLNSVGPRVYRRVLVAKTPERLKRYRPTSDDLCVIEQANEKRLAAGGALILGTKDAGPGYSHASVLARGHGISCIAVPDVAETVRKFFDKQREREGYYVDDRLGSFSIKPLSSALREGVIAEADIERLRPGANTEVRYYDVDVEGQRRERFVDLHHLGDDRETRQIELIAPDLKDTHQLGGVITFARLGAAPIDAARASAGEKGAVLARLGSMDALRGLGVEVPLGAVLPPHRILDLLHCARVGDGSAHDAWMSVWQSDPAVGVVTDRNFERSAFYTDAKYRARKVRQVRRAVETGLSNLLVKGGRPTAIGRALLRELAEAGLDPDTPWIARSSFTGEDRPNKSGAGQYSSFPMVRSGASALHGIVGVISSAWNEAPIERNVEDRIQLQHTWPAVVLQHCEKPTVSGVAVSRGPNGALSEVGYQATEAFGGGVEGGAAEEGVLSKGTARLERGYQGKARSVLSASQQEKLRRAVLSIEREFNRSIEPGAEHAVDVEYAFQGERLLILQARTIPAG